MNTLEKLKIKLQSGFEVHPKLWNEIAENAKKISLKKDEVLVPYSSKRKVVNIVVQGSLKQSLIDSKGKKTATWFFFDTNSDVAVCFDSYYLDEYTKYEVSALENAVVYQIAKEKIENWADRFANFNRFYREDCIKSFMLSVEIRNYMVSHTPSEFLEYIRKSYPQIMLRVPSKYLADFMGITPEWLSKMNRILAKS
ncbi:MAG: hypothetical protein AAGF96_05630 [Bacteroidota bacterium]